MKTKVALSEQELRRLIRASLLEQDGDAPAEINMFSQIDEDAVIGGDAVAKELKKLNEQLGGVALGDVKYTGNQYAAFIKSAAKTLGVDPGIVNWVDSDPTQSQFELVSAYYKLALILLLEREDLTVLPLAVEGSKSLEFVPYIKVDIDPNFYISEEADPSLSVMIDFIRTALYEGSTPFAYKSQQFFDKLSDPTFLQQIKEAKFSTSKQHPDVAFKSFLGDKQAEILSARMVANLNSGLAPLKETWAKLNTGTYENFFAIPVNMPNIWYAIREPASPLYTPWREAWVVCNMINKGLALPQGSAALAAMLYKTYNSGLSAQSGFYRPEEAASTALSTQALNESRRILVTHKELRRIITAALHEYATRPQQAISEGTLDAISSAWKSFKGIFSGREEARVAMQAAYDLLKVTGQENALQVALKALDDVAKIFNPDDLQAIRSMLDEGIAAGKKILDEASSNAPSALTDPGTIDVIRNRPCIAELGGLAANTNPVCAEVARQLLNDGARLALAQSVGDVNEVANIAKKMSDLFMKLDDTQKGIVRTLIGQATPKTGFFKLPDEFEPFVVRRLSDDIDEPTAQARWVDTEQKIVDGFNALGSSVAVNSVQIAGKFAENPRMARRAASEGAQALTGSRVLDTLGKKYRPEMASLAGKTTHLLYGADRYVVSMPTRFAANKLADLFENSPRIASAFEWLASSNVVRAILVKQLVALGLGITVANVGATGISWEDNTALFLVERLSDNNPLSASLAEVLLAVASEAIPDTSPEFLDKEFTNALMQDPQVIADILEGAVEHLESGINIAPGSFPELQEDAKASDVDALGTLSSLTKYFNYSGERRRQAALDALQKAEQLTGAVEASKVIDTTPSKRLDALSAKLKGTTEATKQNVKSAVQGSYAYSAPPNAADLTKDYVKNLPQNSFSGIGLFAAARGADELKMLNILLDEELTLLPDAQLFASIAAVEDAQTGKTTPPPAPTAEDIKMVQALKRLSAAISDQSKPNRVEDASAPDDTAASTP
jgi:hypothetical protein